METFTPLLYADTKQKLSLIKDGGDTSNRCRIRKNPRRHLDKIANKS